MQLFIHFLKNDLSAQLEAPLGIELQVVVAQQIILCQQCTVAKWQRMFEISGVFIEFH